MNTAPRDEHVAGRARGAAAEWTVFLYMAANNDLQTEALQIVEKVAERAFGAEVNVLVQISSPKGVYRARLDRGVERFAEWSNLDMTRGEALTEFLDWGARTFPSRHTALILWGHGGGWEDPDILFGASAASRDRLTPASTGGSR